jgi:hypothetical protein
MYGVPPNPVLKSNKVGGSKKTASPDTSSVGPKNQQKLVDPLLGKSTQEFKESTKGAIKELPLVGLTENSRSDTSPEVVLQVKPDPEIQVKAPVTKSKIPSGKPSSGLKVSKKRGKDSKPLSLSDRWSKDGSDNDSVSSEGRQRGRKQIYREKRNSKARVDEGGKREDKSEVGQNLDAREILKSGAKPNNVEIQLKRENFELGEELKILDSKLIDLDTINTDLVTKTSELSKTAEGLKLELSWFMEDAQERVIDLMSAFNVSYWDKWHFNRWFVLLSFCLVSLLMFDLGLATRDDEGKFVKSFRTVVASFCLVLGFVWTVLFVVDLLLHMIYAQMHLVRKGWFAGLIRHDYRQLTLPPNTSLFDVSKYNHPDLRADAMALGKLTQAKPLYQWVVYHKRFCGIIGLRSDLLLVSFELVAQLATVRNIGLDTTDETAWLKLNNAVISSHMVNIFRYFVIGKQHVAQDTVQVCYALYKEMMERRRDMGFPGTPVF